MPLPDDDVPGGECGSDGCGVQDAAAPPDISARLLGRPPAEWLQVMDRQDVLVTAMPLQRDATLMASNVTVVSQYVTSLHQMSTEVMQSVFGREYIPLQSINDTAPVPRVNHAFTQMAAMGLWRPPISPGGPGLMTAHHNVD